MPIFSVQVFKEASGKRWSNRYHLSAADIAAAQDAAENVILLAEMTIHCTFVNFVEMLVSTTAPDDRIFINTPLSVTGDRTFSTDALPLFNTAMVKFSSGGIGDPARKYYRILTEGDSNGGALQTALETVVLDAMDTMLTTLTSPAPLLTKPDGTQLTIAGIQHEIQERQLRRRRRRRAALP